MIDIKANTKAGRKDAYRTIVNAMINQEHEKAFNLLLSMCADDTGLFLIVDYKAATEAAKNNIA